MNIGTRNILVACALCGALSGFSGPAAAHNSVDFSLSIGVPGVVYAPAYAPAYAPPPEVVYVPRATYYPSPIYYPPTYYSPGGAWAIGYRRGWAGHEWRENHHHHGWRHDDD